jgi:hypothetical protein
VNNTGDVVLCHLLVDYAYEVTLDNGLRDIVLQFQALPPVVQIPDVGGGGGAGGLGGGLHGGGGAGGGSSAMAPGMMASPQGQAQQESNVKQRYFFDTSGRKFHRHRLNVQSIALLPLRQLLLLGCADGHIRVAI